MKFGSIYFICAVFLISCSHTDKKVVAKANTRSAIAKRIANVQSAKDTLAIPDDTIPKITIPENTIQVGEDKLDTASKIKIIYNSDVLNNGVDNVGPEYSKLSWKGIFYNKGNYYIKPTKTKVSKERPSPDEDSSEEPVWILKCEVKDSCFRLISGADDLLVGPIKRVKANDFYYAGQKQEFRYEGVIYTLYTTGTKRNGNIYNFKLFLMANVKGQTFNQLLYSLGNDVALRNGGDNVDTIFISFIGDIDGDKIPDFIIDDGGYAFGSSSLYLSTPAGNNAILKLVGYSESRG
ncbi:MAG: hypothetical protein ACXVAY_03320 [Mucilaginibacter sp.]